MPFEFAGEYTIWLNLASVLVDSVIAILLYKTVKDYAEVAKVSRLQSKQRFRPWIGPTGAFEYKGTRGTDYQYVITIKNFGEIPASKVIGMSGTTQEQPSRDVILKPGLLRSSNLGPLLPYMEKHYWVFVSAEVFAEAKKENKHVFLTTYFSYEFSGAPDKGGYGIISELDPQSHEFIHREMWVDDEN